MASFTGVGDNVELAVTDKGETVSVAISGTYDMTIDLQRAVTPDKSAWETLETWNTANATVAHTLTTERFNEVFRLIVQVDNSGTATATLTDSAKSVSQIKDQVGNVLFEVFQDRIVFPDDVEVTGVLRGEDTAQGTDIDITGGDSSTSANAGGAANITGGTPGATGVGGAVVITGGAGGSTSGAGGAASVTGGAATAGNSAGGEAKLIGGAGQGTSAGGAVTITSGASENGSGVSPGASGAVAISAGAAGTATTGTGGAGGAVSITGAAGGASTGASSTGGAGSDVSITAGAGGASSGGGDTGGAGGDVVVTPGAGGSGATAGLQGRVFIRDSLVFRKQGAQAAKTTDATLTAAELLNGIITVNQGATGTSTLTLPLGSSLEAALPASIAAGDSFEFSLINISTVAGEDASLATNTGWTLVGSMDVESDDADRARSSGRFLVRRTASNTFTIYRLS